jgi:hypothetical protein
VVPGGKVSGDGEEVFAEFLDVVSVLGAGVDRVVNHDLASGLVADKLDEVKGEARDAVSVGQDNFADRACTNESQ